jgi:hypothetical protein
VCRVNWSARPPDRRLHGMADPACHPNRSTSPSTESLENPSSTDSPTNTTSLPDRPTLLWKRQVTARIVFSEPHRVHRGPPVVAGQSGRRAAGLRGPAAVAPGLSGALMLAFPPVRRESRSGRLAASRRRVVGRAWRFRGNPDDRTRSVGEAVITDRASGQTPVTRTLVQPEDQH